ncbi:tRNA (adenosine(37)-N6)-threonylcarbamoyltransferase complex dimerization subunit type 1 TsaB [Cellulophaga baltica]|uniref:tRNA (adenosine(37)-N6)-threonylcarbamoyltransferase complex dimerization subunit type 1 TsaB n=1 Tax=Cellulophaga TaxID=104264 RepID=UPI001C06C8F4|nr:MULTISPECIES: tRNA (adenosine(37)-N6)-threonylcarbamoyltransferase complex dimerization subunit type 1 TsaB [Cellulophaga]MBU2995191.1 tRNA (adenosine(37)-N6)-threonylcarbamoyltransferase complex dimerization subunit type 1 TsaB [Cellulophaga baltica]MDO6766586.1 tRNA (adenosine(37)-N6)-threonylcarbamoyltransferase complex dimerization subunit type 1 TsaB [Cellulophaga sp. 1_MG-2023]
MGVILNIETATTNCSVSIAKDENLLAIKEFDSASYSHAEQLHLFIEEVVKNASLELNDLNAIAVSKGPGSYTGLRIGVSAAKGLCFALDIPLISIPTLESIANKEKEFTVDYIIPVLDARRMEVYSAVYNDALVEIRETRAEIIEENSFEEYAAKGIVLIVGSGAEKCKEILKSINFKFQTTAVPSAKEMVLLSNKKFKENNFENVAYFEPYYLKDFIALKKKS